MTFCPVCKTKFDGFGSCFECETKNKKGGNLKQFFGVTLIGSFFLLFILGTVAFVAVPAVYGLVLAFRASIILFILVLIIQPSPTILGWIAIFGRPDVSAKLAAWLHLPF